METSIEYRLVSGSGEKQHSRTNDEGIQVTMSAVSSAPGVPAVNLDMNESIDSSIFNSNYECFKAENLYSSVGNIDNVFFKEIVEMGRRAVPYIYKELLKGPNDLVYALDSIFGHPIEYQGFVSLKRSCDLWISILQQTEMV